MDKDKYKKQIDRFYKGQFHRTEMINIGSTPDLLCNLGVKKLPLVMTQSNLRKCIREPHGSRSAHQIGREIVEQLPECIARPVLIVDNPDKKGILLLTDRLDVNNRAVVVAIHQAENKAGQQVNEVKSIYGRERLEDYLKREKENIIYQDKTKVRHLLRDVRKQYSQPPIRSDYSFTISYELRNVNDKNKKNLMREEKLFSKSEIAKDLRWNGFQPTKKLIKNIEKLQKYTGERYLLKDIHTLYQNMDDIQKPRVRDCVERIVDECRIQEIERLQLPPPEM